MPVPSLGDALVAAAAAPNGDGRVFAISRQGAAVVYTADRGWTFPDTGLAPALANGRYVQLRAVAWPRPDVVIGVGSAGALVTALRDPVPFDLGLDDDTRGAVETYDDLPVEATLLAIACNANDALECTAVGRNGLIVRGNGLQWHVEHLPAGVPAATDLTSVAYDGRTPLVATTAGLFQGDGDGEWTRDDALQTALSDAGLPPAVTRVATEPGGGTVVDGHFERDAPTAPWRATSAPLDLYPVAIAAIRDGGQVRTIVSAAPSAPPLPEPVKDEPRPPNGPDGPRPDPVPLDASPVDAMVLRETADGWVDLDGASYQPSGGRDLPQTTPNTRVLVLDQDGTGMALGGIAGTVTDPRAPDPVAASASVRRLDHGAPAPSPRVASEPGETGPTPAGTVRLAIGGHPACLDRCTGGGGQGLTPRCPRRHRARAREGDGRRRQRPGRAALRRRPRLARRRAAGRGRCAPLPRADPGRRRADLRPARPGRHAGWWRRGVRRRVRRRARAPGDGGAPRTASTRRRARRPRTEAPGARRAFAFDVRAAAGTVRVVAIDNAAGRLAGGIDGPQAQWLRDTMVAAHAQGFPVVVVGSASLDGAQRMPRADDADQELGLLAGLASAYVATAGVDDPDDPHFGGVLSRSELNLPGTPFPLAVFQSSTLGYSAPRSAIEFEEDTFDEAEITRQTTAALLMIDVAVDRMDPATGLAPVTGGVGAARGHDRARLHAAGVPGRLRAAAVGHRDRPGVDAVPGARQGHRRAADRARLHGCVPAPGPVRVVVADVRHGRADRHRLHLVEPAGRALRGRAARHGRERPWATGDRPRRERARRRRPARPVLPAVARRHGGQRDGGRPARHDADPGRLAGVVRPAERDPDHADPARHVRLPRLHDHPAGRQAGRGRRRRPPRACRGSVPGRSCRSRSSRPRPLLHTMRRSPPRRPPRRLRPLRWRRCRRRSRSR